MNSDDTTRQGSAAIPKGFLKRLLSRRNSPPQSLKRNKRSDSEVSIPAVYQHGIPPAPDKPKDFGKAIANGHELPRALSNRIGSQGYRVDVEAGPSTKFGRPSMPTTPTSRTSRWSSGETSGFIVETDTGVTSIDAPSNPMFMDESIINSGMKPDAPIVNYTPRSSILRTTSYSVHSEPKETVEKGAASESSLIDTAALSRVVSIEYQSALPDAGPSRLPEMSKVQSAPARGLSDKAKGKQRVTDAQDQAASLAPVQSTATPVATSCKAGNSEDQSSPLTQAKSAPIPSSFQPGPSEQKPFKIPANKPEPVPEKKKSSFLSKLKIFSSSNKKNLVQYPVSNGVKHAGGMVTTPLDSGSSKCQAASWEKKVSRLHLPFIPSHLDRVQLLTTFAAAQRTSRYRLQHVLIQLQQRHALSRATRC